MPENLNPVSTPRDHDSQGYPLSRIHRFFPLFGRELILGGTADRANPVLGKLFKRDTCCDPRIGIPRLLVINITAYSAYVLDHNFLLPK
jgi:hypothetical protein